MYNGRTKRNLVKNQRNYNVDSLKSCKIHCSCSNTSKFKSNQSDKWPDKKTPWIQTAEESQKLLRHELEKYGLEPRKSTEQKVKETKHYNSPSHDGKVNINVRNLPVNKIIKVNIKEILCDKKCNKRIKAKTLPNLDSERYVDELKKEISVNENDFVSLSKRYKQKYLNSLKEELLLDKITKQYESNKHVEDIRKEIENFRAKKSPYLYRSNLSKPSSDVESMKDERSSKWRTSRRVNSEKRDRYSPDVSLSYRTGHHHSSTKDSPRDRSENSSRHRSPRIRKKYAAISTQCEFDIIQNNFKPNMLKNLDDIHDLIPKLSAVIKDSEKNLETALAMTIKPPKILQERGVSPIKEFSKSSSNKQDTESQNPSNIENQMNAQKQEECHDVVGEIKPIEMLSDKQDETPTPFIGNLLANIENIKESKCLLDEFQNELSQIKKDIQECAICTSRLKESQTSDKIEKNYCDKHDIYVPLLKMEGISSRSEQIQLINTLRTEISLKKELEYQLQNISRLEKELSRVKTTQNEDEVKTVETTLEFTRSYFNNLLVKQETERLLNEQQKLLKKQCDHSCDDSIKCDKCAVEKQIHELIGKIRMCISKDLKDASQRLKVQKMPSINIRKPLQLQNTLLLNIPPSFASHELSQKNIACETVIISDDNNTKRETETQVSTNKSRNIEIHPENNLYEHQRKEKTTKHKRKSSGSLAQNPLCSKEKCDRYRVVSEMNEKQIAKNNENRMPFNNFETEICSDIYDKTPSQLGFNRTIATQCDSTVSLGDNFSILTIEEVEKQRTAATQTVVCDDDSIYLFGFREYLLKRSPELALVPRVDDNKVDVELQVSMTESLESSLESKSLGVDAKSNVRKASVTILTPTKLSDYLKGEDDNISQLPSKEDDHSTQKYSFTKRVRKLERTPSIKKMFLLPAVPVQTSEASTNQPISAIELAIINPYIEPKYKMKRYSISNQDSDATNEAKGDVFYKSLISKEELPERKTLNQIESHTQEKHSVEELSEALRSINLETSAFEDQSLLNKTVIENINDQTKKINITPTENERIQEDYVKPENKNVTDDYEKKTFVNKLESIIPKEPYDSSQERNKIGEDENIRSQDAAIHSNIENGENKSRKNEKPDDSHDEKKHENSHIKYETTISADHSGIDEIRLGKKSYALEESIKEKENKNIQDSAEANENLEKNIVETQPKENEHKMKKALEEKKVSIGKSYIDDDENSGSHDTNELEEKTVYTVFPSNYQLKINTNEKFKKLLNENISMDYPVCFKSTKTFEKYKHPDDFSRDSEDTDLQSTLVEKFRNSKGKNLKNEAHHGVYYRNDTNQINRNEIQITENSKNLRSPVSNIIDERLQYSKKCAMVEDSSYSSNILSSEGEIKCKCRAVSMGELHRCPHSKKETVVKSMQPGIHYKEKISSQLLLEKERKHYNHWVTYYSTKKIANGSSSSSMDSKIDKG